MFPLSKFFSVTMIKMKVFYLTNMGKHGSKTNFSDSNYCSSEIIEKNGIADLSDFFGRPVETVIIGHDRGSINKLLDNNLSDFIENHSKDVNHSKINGNRKNETYDLPHIVCAKLTNLSLLQTKEDGNNIEPRLVGKFQYSKLGESYEKKIFSTMIDTAKKLNSASPFYNIRVNHINLSDKSHCSSPQPLLFDHYWDSISRNEYSKSEFIQKYGKEIVTCIINIISQNNTDQKFKIGMLLKNIPTEHITPELIEAITLNYDTNIYNLDHNLWSLNSVPRDLMTPQFIKYFQECVLLFLEKNIDNSYYLRRDFYEYNFQQGAINVKSFLLILNNLKKSESEKDIIKRKGDILNIKNIKALLMRIAHEMTENEIRENIHTIMDMMFPEHYKEFLVQAPNDLFTKNIIDKILSHGLGSYYILCNDSDDNTKYDVKIESNFFPRHETRYDVVRMYKESPCRKYFTGMNHGCECDECKKVRIIAKKICDNIDFNDEKNIDNLVLSHWFTAVVEQMSDKQKIQYGFTDDFIQKCIMYQKLNYYLVHKCWCPIHKDRFIQNEEKIIFNKEEDNISNYTDIHVMTFVKYYDQYMSKFYCEIEDFERKYNIKIN